MDHLNAVIETAALGARLDVPLLRRADTEPAIPSHQQRIAAGGRAGTAGGKGCGWEGYMTLATPVLWGRGTIMTPHSVEKQQRSSLHGEIAMSFLIALLSPTAAYIRSKSLAYPEV